MTTEIIIISAMIIYILFLFIIFLVEITIKRQKIKSLYLEIQEFNDYCIQKENKIEDLKKKLQREQTYKSNARKQLKQRTKQRDELLKKIKNIAT